MPLLFGCTLAFGAALFPRVILLLAWLFSDRWQVAFQTWIWPLLGLIFLPYTTIMYLLVWKPTGIQGWDWMWILLGVMLDVMKWGQIANNRKGIPGYPQSQPSGTATTPTA
jgi:hypothetical protein